MNNRLDATDAAESGLTQKYDNKTEEKQKNKVKEETETSGGSGQREEEDLGEQDVI